MRLSLFVRCGRGLAALTATAWMASCAVAQSVSTSRATPSRMQTTYAQMPVQLCLPTDPVSLSALREGRSRLNLHVQHRRAAARYSPTFAVTLVNLATQRRTDIERFSMHADHLEGSEAPPAQHFGFNLSERIPASTTAGSLCIEVSVDLSDGDRVSFGATQVSISATIDPVGAE